MSVGAQVWKHIVPGANPLLHRKPPTAVPALRPVRLRPRTGTFFATPLGPNQQPRRTAGLRASHVKR